MIDRFNGLSMAVCYWVTREEKLRKRAQVLTHLIEIAEVCNEIFEATEKEQICTLDRFLLIL